jgi:hypothetical protein
LEHLRFGQSPVLEQAMVNLIASLKHLE